MHSETLWAITSYFNPAGYARRLANYQLFRERLAVPLVTVELSFNGRFQLGRRDADVLVQLHGTSVMWQKERLLNIAVKNVPCACDKIAWLDCDVVFESDEWVRQAVQGLDEFSMLHLFQERHNLPLDASTGRLGTLRGPLPAQSVVYKMAKGEATPQDLFSANAPVELHTTAGLAWASRRDVLERHGLYDACITGSGDRAILCAALGQFDYGIRAVSMNGRLAEHYLKWAQPFFATIGGNVGCIQGRLLHLWHGDLGNRQYQARHAGLADFDPDEDIALDHNGCWRWNSDKAELHTLVARYFESRREDGAQ
jgi:hypothetical protein